MRFITMFPEAENVHLIKDVGMIPYVMYKEYGFDSTIVCYENGKYPYLNKELKGLKIDFIKRYTGISAIDGAIYLIKNSKNIDILNLYHCGNRTKLWIALYKLLNKSGKIYLKLDSNKSILNTVNPSSKTFKGFIKRNIFNKCNLISIEIYEVYKYLRDNWKINISYVPNGFYDYGMKQMINYDEKDNIILTVGRIGSYEKANDILLNGFKMALKNIDNWKLKIVGPIDSEFKEYINKYFKENPELKDKVIITGAIYDRNKLEEEYKKAKIFCLTSRHEGFPLVYIEAIKNGCYIITSNVDSAPDITHNGEYGDIFKIDDINGLSKYLIKNCNDDEKLKTNCGKIQRYAYKNFNWKILCERIIYNLHI